MDVLFPFHPRLVHFPIALLLVAVTAIAFGILRRQDRWLGYGRTSLLLGWLGVLVAIATGLVDQSHAPQADPVSSAINQHITAGIALLIVFGLALYWPLRSKKLFTGRQTPWAYLALLLVGMALIFLEGLLGGKLVYQLGVGVR